MEKKYLTILEIKEKCGTKPHVIKPCPISDYGYLYQDIGEIEDLHYWVT